LLPILGSQLASDLAERACLDLANTFTAALHELSHHDAGEAWQIVFVPERSTQ
jgi:hypothetical protein